MPIEDLENQIERIERKLEEEQSNVNLFCNISLINILVERKKK